MIVTVSPNVALDRVRVIRGFQPGKQSRALSEFLQPGGSGVHAASVIQSLGGESIALGLLGGHTGELWKTEADKRGLTYDMIPIQGETRESFCLIDLDQGSVVESVEEGPGVDSTSRDALLSRLEMHLPNAELIILSGSLPPGIPIDLYADMIELAHRHEVRTLADIHSEPLRRSISSKPWLIKPNLSEFHELIGHSTQDLIERTKASRDFYGNTGIVLALSMSDEGLLLTTADEQWLVIPPLIKMHLPDGLGQNVIGCGDALVGALAYEYCQSRNLLESTRLGLAAAHYYLSTFGVPEIDPDEVIKLVNSVQLFAL
jgi:1-phosphofructokinase family hexose kinase